jgi:hypothetical protein
MQLRPQTWTEHVEAPSSDHPPLSVVIATRGHVTEMRYVLDALLPQIRDVGGEVVVVAGHDDADAAMQDLRWISVPGEKNLLRLRAIGLRAARGGVIATGEDHAVPGPDWCAAILRAHGEHPAAAAVAGCVVNGTPNRVSASANFLSYAAPYMPPMSAMPNMPPPYTVLSFKRAALAELDDRPGMLEARLVPELFERGAMVADDRVVIAHYQDLNLVQAIDNVYSAARCSYGYALAGADRARRREVARWIVKNVPRIHLGEARKRVPTGPRGWPLLGNLSVLVAATAIGGAIGALFGPGRTPDRTA